MSSIYSDLVFNKHEQDIVNELLQANPYNKEFILNKLDLINSSKGLSSVLILLFHHQIENGFVLSDPCSDTNIKSKYYLDKQTGIKFCLQWNPNRELRLNHDLLIQKGVIVTGADQNLLTNTDERGKPCYLCSNNIEIQNPVETLFPTELSGIKYFCGANFAPITNNHFTIMTEVHKPQEYDSNVILSMLDFALKTNGVFRAIFNGKAGASILSHLHFQGTTEKLPVEDIKITNNDLIYCDSVTNIFKLNYCLPLVILESESIESISRQADLLIKKWVSIKPEFNTQNILAVKQKSKFKLYIFLRDSRKLKAREKQGDMGTFECSGFLVLSKGVRDNRNPSTAEGALFENSSLDTVKNLLAEIAPEEKLDINKINFS